jgi:hypothetical protein
MIYGSLGSLWPVNTGVLVSDGIAYAGAGIVDRDGTYMYALDAVTGVIKWQNGESGHINKEMHKGVSVQGDITIGCGSVWLAGGNQISPVGYNIDTGRVNDYGAIVGGKPSALRGSEIGMFADRYLIYGGKLLYDDKENNVNSSRFFYSLLAEDGKPKYQEISPRYIRKLVDVMGIPPVWNNEIVVTPIRGQKGLRCWSSDVFESFIMEKKNDMKEMSEYEQKGNNIRPLIDKAIEREKRVREQVKWEQPQYEILSVAVAGNAVVAVCELPKENAQNSPWAVCAFDKEKGNVVWEKPLSSEPLLNGLLVDRDGRVVVVLQNGSVVCYGARM